MPEVKLSVGGKAEGFLRLVKWYKQEGEKVEKGEVLLSVTEGKANYEIEAPFSGTLKKQLSPMAGQFEIGKAIAIIE